MSKFIIHPAARIGHLNLKVADMGRALAFYCDVLGFRIRRYRPGCRLAFLGAGETSFDLAITTDMGQEGSPPSAGCTGLDHFAIRYPSRQDLARAYRHLMECGVELREATDHWIAESLYFDDPDGNQVEIYWERPPEYWFEADGQIRSQLKPLDLTSLLAELNEPEASIAMPAEPS
jgi:catechol 2,3-dioxygenase